MDWHSLSNTTIAIAVVAVALLSRISLPSLSHRPSPPLPPCHRPAFPPCCRRPPLLSRQCLLNNANLTTIVAPSWSWSQISAEWSLFLDGMVIWRVPVITFAQFWPLNWINRHALTLLDIIDACTGCICKDGLTGTEGTSTSRRCSQWRLLQNWRGAVTNFAWFLPRM